MGREGRGVGIGGLGAHRGGFGFCKGLRRPADPERPSLHRDVSPELGMLQGWNSPRMGGEASLEKPGEASIPFSSPASPGPPAPPATTPDPSPPRHHHCPPSRLPAAVSPLSPLSPPALQLGAVGSPPGAVPVSLPPVLIVQQLPGPGAQLPVRGGACGHSCDRQQFSRSFSPAFSRVRGRGAELGFRNVHPVLGWMFGPAGCDFGGFYQVSKEPPQPVGDCIFLIF